jgi:hypothetical protein
MLLNIGSVRSKRSRELTLCANSVTCASTAVRILVSLSHIEKSIVARAGKYADWITLTVTIDKLGASFKTLCS